GQTSVILKMINNGAGGCGNDLAIDDIVFKTCGDNINLTDTSNNVSLAICEDEGPISTTLNANPDFSVYSDHAYQWQVSNDGNIWNDIAGATGQTYDTPLLNTTTFYRVKVAEDAINLANDKCNTVSDIFKIDLITKPNPPMSDGDVVLCADELGGVSVSVTSGVIVDWYDAPMGGNLLLGNSLFIETDQNGTYYAQARSPNGNCSADNRTAVSIVYNDHPVEANEKNVFCEGTSLVLTTTSTYIAYIWNTGATTPSITIDAPGDYTVTVTDNNGCSNTKSFEISQIDLPIITNVVSDHRDFTVMTATTGDYEYSIDGFNYQESPLFANKFGATYVIYVRDGNGCGVVEYVFDHLVVPRFFTPNGDGVNDWFKAEGITPNKDFEMRIFNRTSNLIYQTTNKDFSWDGRFMDRPLPASDYWYVMRVGEQMHYGHFALKR
ncbi:MAG: T9SS type B sorting domain-containing protein, partial [Croceitalea sp.]|nr:T9SS type B sorting domain-containing protein [Croceitalea sp.]